tara:strand:+ start:359 stop:1555 length:1197 start_codon:yes stop_codon:yes gene_type:complete
MFFAFLLQYNQQTYIFPDSYSYLLSIKQFFFEFKLNDHRPFLFSLLNGIPLLFNLSIDTIFEWSLFLNIISWLGIILLIYKISSTFINREKAFIFSLIYVFLIGSLGIVFHLLTETFFTFFLTLIIYQFRKFELTKNNKYLSYAIALLFLSLLIKPILKFFVLVVIIFYYKDFFELIKSKFSILIYLSISLVFFQMYSIRKTYGIFTISTIDASTYYNYLGTKADCFKNNIEFEQGHNQRHLYFSKLSLLEKKEVAIEDLKQQIKSNKVNLVKAYFSNLYVNSSKGSASVFGCDNIINTSYFAAFQFIFKAISKTQNIFFTLSGVIVSIIILRRNEQEEKTLKIVSLAILYLFFISGVSSDQGDRLHIVFFPLVIILMAKFFNYKCIKTKPFFALLQK